MDRYQMAQVLNNEAVMVVAKQMNNSEEDILNFGCNTGIPEPQTDVEKVAYLMGNWPPS